MSKGKRKCYKIPRITCPKCRSDEIKAIVYGLPLENIDEPGKDLFGAAKKGYIELGGCCIEENSPEFRCKSCGLGFRK